MGLNDFKTDDSKTSSVTNASGPKEGGVEEFISEDDESIEIEGGFELDLGKQDDFDTEVVKVFGGPGTGKTTTLVGNTEIDDFKGILQRMFEEYSPDELLLIAYTRAAADEAKERLAKLTDTNKSTLDDRITTIHSLAMSENNLGPKDIVEIRYANDKYNFCNEVGMEFDKSGGDDDPSEMMADPDDEGHLFFKMLGWLKSSLKPASEWADCPLADKWQRDGEEFVRFAEAWDGYKNDKGIWEFDDAIMECVNSEVTVNADYLFVDEVQDLYPLQQAFIDNQFGAVKRIFLGGDDDQTIYEWAGAKPEYFLDMEGKVNNEMPELWEDKTGYWQEEGVYILDQSWRMPNNILDLAKMCIHKVDERQEKQIKPHHEGGQFVPLRDPYPEDVISHINHDDTMILFRTNYQIGNFADELIDAGIPYKDYRFKNSSYGTWNKDSLRFRDGMRAIIKKEKSMTGNQASTIIQELPDAALHRPNQRTVDSNTFSKQKEVPTDEVVDKVTYDWPEDMRTLKRWLIEFEELNWYQERAVRNNLTSEHIGKYPQGLNLSTIHGSKGREADTIILSLSTTQSVMENMPKGGITDAERRLYYVGMTRTENKLVVAEGLDKETPTLTLDTILGQEWRDQYEWQNRK